MAGRTTRKSGRQAEFDEKISRIREYLRTQKLGAVALSSQALFSWATAGGDNYVVMGSDAGVATLLVTPDQITVLSNNIESARLRNEEFKGLNLSKVEFWSCPWHEDQIIEGEIRRRVRDRWLSDSTIGDCRVDESLIRLTYTLTDNEISRYRTLAKDCSAAMEESLVKARPGLTEHQMAGFMCERLWDHGVRPQVILVASDERVFQVRHPIAKDKKIKKHLMAVICGKRGGLIANLTRLVHFGRSLPEELRHKHDAVCAVDVAFIAATRAGVPIKEIFAAGVSEYARQGFADEWKFHHQGGPTGYQGRSFRGTPTETRNVLNRQAFAWNPSIAGTKSEDTILVNDGEIEFLTRASSKWPMIKVKSGGKTYARPDIKLV